MSKKLLKIGAGLVAGASSLYWGVLPALAVVSPLCPDAAKTGITPPGCGGTIPTVQNIITFVLNILLFASFIIALVFLIIGGIKWIMSGGDKEGASKAKETVTSALIGLAVVLGAWILINIVISTLTGGSLSTILVPSLTPPTGTTP